MEKDVKASLDNKTGRSMVTKVTQIVLPTRVIKYLPSRVACSKPPSSKGKSNSSYWIELRKISRKSGSKSPEVL